MFRCRPAGKDPRSRKGHCTMQIANRNLPMGSGSCSARGHGLCRSARIGLVLACCVTLVALLPAAQEELSDPLPIRRVLIAPERVPAEMKRVEQGVLVQM